MLADGAAGRSSLFRPLKNDARDTSFLLLEMTANKLAEDEREQRAFEMKFGQRRCLAHSDSLLPGAVS